MHYVYELLRIFGYTLDHTLDHTHLISYHKRTSVLPNDDVRDAVSLVADGAKASGNSRVLHSPTIRVANGSLGGREHKGLVEGLEKGEVEREGMRAIDLLYRDIISRLPNALLLFSLCVLSVQKLFIRASFLHHHRIVT